MKYTVWIVFCDDVSNYSLDRHVIPMIKLYEDSMKTMAKNQDPEMFLNFARRLTPQKGNRTNDRTNTGGPDLDL